MLLVEDNLTDKVLTEFMLISELGVLPENLMHALSGPAAIDILCPPPKRSPGIIFDLIILDYDLQSEEVNGISIARQLAERMRYDTPPIIMLSGCYDLENKDLSSVNFLLQKPASLDDLKDIFTKINFEWILTSFTPFCLQTISLY